MSVLSKWPPRSIVLLLSQASPLWLRASGGHPGWPCCENTVATFPWRGRCVYLAYGAYRDTDLRHAEWDWLTAVCVCLRLPATTSSVKGICKPFFRNSTLFSRSDLIDQMAHCCRAACLSFNCSPRVFYLNRCIKCIRHSYRNVNVQVHLSTA